MKISILHPSRSRPLQALNTSRSWLKSLSGSVAWEYIISLDESDPMLSEYEELFYPPFVCVSANDNVVQASNVAAKHSEGEILILISDDFGCFKNWDLAIIEALKDKSGVLKTFDGVQRWMVTLPIMTRDYYDEQGCIYYPGYEHMFADTDQTHKADLQKKLIIRNDIVFKHNHYSVKGGQQRDAVNFKADKTWGQGEKVYLQRCRSKFGLNVRSVYDLSPQARIAGHINWMKKKGIR